MYSLENFERDVLKHDIHPEKEVLLAPYTTFRIGGSADLVISATNLIELELTYNYAMKHNIPILIIGKGSNVLIADSGFRGVVILNKTQDWNIIKNGDAKAIDKTSGKSRYDSKALKKEQTFSYNDQKEEAVLVRADSGIQITPLMKKLFHNGISGLQWFAGIPSSIGGAIYMNMHGGDHYFGDLIYQAMISDGSRSRRVSKKYFEFDYDWSILHQSKELVLWADLRLRYGNVEKAKELAHNWAKIKSIQPQRSAGCIFKNLTEKQKEELSLPTQSMGYVIDKILGLKGTKCGDAMISEDHAAFIENKGNAKASDVITLINMIRKQAKNKLGITLELEIKIVK